MTDLAPAQGCPEPSRRARHLVVQQSRRSPYAAEVHTVGQRSFGSLTLETTRLLLPPLDRTHAAVLATIYRDGDVAKYIGGSALSDEGTRSQVDAFERIWRERGYGQSALIERATGQMIGRAELIAVIHPENHKSRALAARLGFVHGRDDVTPKGVGVCVYRRELRSHPEAGA